MSKIKDLITDAKFKLLGQVNISVGKGKDKVSVVAYLYEDKVSGALIRFYYHPTKKIYVVMPETNELGMLLKDVVVNAWVKQGGRSKEVKEIKL